MKTDSNLKRDVEAELAADPAVRSDAIGVVVKDGVVTVSGHLESYPEKWAVERALQRVAGVHAVALELDVRLSPQHRRSDTEIAQAAEHALQWHAMVPPEAVRVTVDQGWLTLQGELDWNYQRKSVEQMLRNLVGVVDVNNEITLKRRPLPENVQRTIAEALTRQAVRAAGHLDIVVQGGTVTLRGTVHSRQERDAARGAAWAVPGVSRVISELKIDGGSAARAAGVTA
jgi:osmotically-inducible protein OsmY